MLYKQKHPYAECTQVVCLKRSIPTVPFVFSVLPCFCTSPPSFHQDTVRKFYLQVFLCNKNPCQKHDLVHYKARLHWCKRLTAIYSKPKAKARPRGTLREFFNPTEPRCNPQCQPFRSFERVQQMYYCTHPLILQSCLLPSLPLPDVHSPAGGIPGHSCGHRDTRPRPEGPHGTPWHPIPPHGTPWRPIPPHRTPQPHAPHSIPAVPPAQRRGAGRGLPAVGVSPALGIARDKTCPS